MAEAVQSARGKSTTPAPGEATEPARRNGTEPAGGKATDVRVRGSPSRLISPAELRGLRLPACDMAVSRTKRVACGAKLRGLIVASSAIVPGATGAPHLVPSRLSLMP